MAEFTEEAYIKLLDRFPDITPRNLFLVLGKIQDEFGFIPVHVVADLADRTGLPEARIYGAVTSYRGFTVKSNSGDHHEAD